MSKFPWMVLPLALSLGVSSCQPIVPLHQAIITQVPSVQGRVSDLLPARSIAAQISDVANGATVSLIDTTTGVTVATTVTTPTGGFTLSFGSDFKPVTGKPYYMEAVKGLPVGGASNRAGAAIARVRTILFYNWNGWSSLSGGVGLPVSIGKATTTVAAIVSLKGLSTASQSVLVGTVNGLNFSDPSQTIGATDFSTVFALVDAAITADQDPLEAIGYDSSVALPGSQYVKKAGNLVIHDNYSINGAPSPATASLNAPYNTITFYGQNFPSSASVTVGTVPVATWSVNAGRTQLTATLASNGYSGGLQITQGKSTWYGPFVPVIGTVGTFAGSGYPGFADGKGTTARFQVPLGITMDANGNIYVGGFYNQSIRKIAPNGLVSTIAGSGILGFSDGAAASAQFNFPRGLVLDSSGNLYVADSNNHRIRKISPSGTVSTLAGSGVAGTADGTGTAAEFNAPMHLAIDASGSLYSSDYGSARIRKITPEGVVTTIAGSTQGFADGAGAAAQFLWPHGLAVDGNGNLFVADASNHRIRKITPAGIVSTYAGTGGTGFADGATSSAQLRYPSSVQVDALGNVYVASDYRVRKITPAGIVSTLAGCGISGMLNAAAVSAQVFAHQIVIAPNGCIYFADSLYNRIGVFTP